MNYNENDAIMIIDFFKKKGFPDMGICAILGNWQAESSLRSNNAQNSYMNKLNKTDEEYTAAVDGGYWKRTDTGAPFVADSIGYGLAQWTSSGRKTRLYEYAKSKNVSISNALMQMEFALQELQTSYKNTYKMLLNPTSIREATIQMLVDYERPAKKDDPNVQNTRVGYAEAFYEKFFGGTNMTNKVLAISAGHYKYTSGKRCLKSLDPNETREWVLNSRIAEKLIAILNQYEGITIVRLDDPTGETAVELKDRAKKSNSSKADFYLAIHHNAGIKGGSGGGIVVYHYPNTRGKNNGTDMYRRLIAHTGLKGNRANPVVATTSLYEVAVPVAPALLVENGFMDSKVDVPIILSEAHADKTAQAMAEFFISAWNLQHKNNKALEIEALKKQIAELQAKLKALENS